jgi:hypothetical protein
LRPNTEGDEHPTVGDTCFNIAGVLEEMGDAVRYFLFFFSVGIGRAGVWGWWVH